MKFKNYIETESGIKDTSTSPGTAGQLLSSTVTGTSWIDQNTISSGSSEVVDIQVKNISSANSGVNLSKGDPVYIYGSVGASARLYVDLADSDSTETNNLGDNKMPCVGLLDQDLAPNEEGTATVVGKLRNLITSPIDGATPNENDTVYVKPGGGLTLTKPIGSTNLIQNVGQVGRVSTSADGNIVVAALLRTNDVPNLPIGRLFVGTNTNTSLVSDVVYVDDANDRVGIGTNNPSYQLQVTGDSSDAPLFQVDDSGDPYLQIKPDSNTFFKIGDMGGLGNEAFIEGNYFDLKFNVAGNTTMTLEGNNRVGIGTTNPDSKLEVASTDSNTYLHVRNDSTGSTRLKMSNLTDTNSNGFQIINNGLNGQVNLLNYKATTLALWTSGSQRITILSGGNVGIGTTSPDSKLHVYANNDNAPTVLTIENGDLGVVAGQDLSKIEFLTNDESSPGAGVAASIRTVCQNAGNIFDLAFNTQNGSTRTERMRLTGVGNLGIGTTSPPDKLSISGGTLSVSGSGSGFGVVKLGDPTVSTPYVGVYRSAAAAIATSGNFLNLGGYDGIAFTTGAAELSGQPERMRITNTGRVGIGTTSPSFILDVANGINYNDVFRINGANADVLFTGNTTAPTGGVGLWNFINTGTNATTRFYVQDANNSNDRLTFRFTGSNGSNEILAGTSSGRVGIGTTSPQAKLHVANGTLRTWTPTTGTSAIFESTASNRNFLTITATNESEIWFGDATTQAKGRVRYENNNNTMEFWTNSISRMHIDSIGNVGIGTTIADGKLHIYGTSDSVSGLVLEATNNGDNRSIDFQNTGGGLRLGLEYDNANINLNIVNRSRGKLVTFREGGNVGIGTSTPNYQLQLSLNSAAKPSSSLWTVVSDSRVKENIRDYTTGLEAILKIEPKIYDYNGKAGFEKTKDNIGIIAQDMQNVMPETIKTYNTKLNEEDTEDTELLNFDGHAVTFALINAVKDLKAEIEELKKQINK